MRKVLDLGRPITWGSGGEGLALEIESFVGPVKLHEPIGECNLVVKLGVLQDSEAA